ncbi:class II aldolase/adducin family protein [Methanolacinia petrolearia DSM 11571]|uniref:Class II aldolase/adducin family protein n=1 Tax=Methanolacinia petrolearia (strain DSM 11571 / OCM 486 / SEBR 4847) TaxID=679926 RepID=E1RHE2_METP4|nr:aldolase [Methanolacinia petrolearia]ADN36446.1 class II aldolase/adducin family protein [Methanolacinia petrolearia DSM 11571]
MQNKEFELTGRRLFNEGLVAGNFGNMSVRVRGGFLITSSGSFLDEEESLKFVTMDGVPEDGASSEWRVHYRAYLACDDAEAIVHAHPPLSVAASLVYDEIIPEDSEGKMLCPVIPVVDGEPGTDELAENVAKALVSNPVVVAKGHGTFAKGKDLKEAYLLTSTAEHCCKILYYLGGFGGRSF